MNPLMMTATKGDLQLPDLTEGMSRRQGTKVLDQTQSEPSPIFNRQQRVVNHDAHRVQRHLEARKAQSLPPPRRNGYLVTSEYLAPDRDRGRYHGDDGQARKEEASHSRQLSLPFKNTKAENRRDKARSAPSHQDAPPQGVPAPRVNNFLSGASLYGGDSGQVSKGFAGVPTRHQDESHLKSNKFASSWAQVRAENHIEVTASNERGTDPGTEAGKTHDSTKHSPRKTEKTTSPFHARPREEPEKSRASKPHPGRATQAQSRDSQATKSQQGHLFHARPREEGNDQSLEPTAAQQPTSRLSTKSGQSKSEKDAQASKLVTPTEVDGIKDGFRDTKIKDNEVDGRNPPANGAERMPGKRRPAWNDRLALNPEAVQPTRGSWCRYEAELTYKPTTTSTQNIQKAYLAPPKTVTLDTVDDVDKVSPRQLPTAGEPTAGDEDGVTSEGNPGDKEYILSRAEARMFLQMQETYGSDAFLTARKKRFFKALLEVQKQEEKRQVEEQRRRKKKMEESKKRQHRQLLYVRRKYRAEQAHRFRTQYVTLRVFERKRADRLMYGLPDDSDDEIFDGTGIEDQEADGKEKSNILQYKNNSRNENGGGMQTAAAKNMADKQHPIRAADSDENNPKHQSPQRKVTFSPDKGTDQSPSGHPLDSHTNEQSVKHSEKSDISGNGSSKNALVKPDPRMPGDDNKETSVKVEESGSNNKSATTEYEAGSPNKKKQNQKELSPTGGTTGTSGSNPSKRDNTVGPRQVKEHQPPQTNDSRAKALDGKKTVAKPLSTTAATESKERLNMADSGQANKQTEQGSNNSVAASGSNPRAGDTGQSTKVKAGSKEQINIANSGKDFVDSDKVSKANVDNFGSNPSKSDSSVSGKKIGEQHSPQQNFQHTSDDSSNTHTAVPLTVTNPSNSNKSRDMVSSQKGQVTSDSNQEKKMNPNLRSTATKDTKEAPTKILVPKSNTGPGPTNTADTRDTNIVANPNSSSKPGADGRQKENIPVRKDSTVARTEKTNAADGRFLTTRASSVEKGRVGKDPKANGDNIKTNSSATTVNRKQKRKPSRRHAQSEEEKKAQMEKQYQHMFGATSDKPRLVVPKMEGIDTVIIKELDKEGRTRTKKKDVKDVVREAKEVANTASGSDPLATTTDIGLGHQQRPASVDTLDFDDDDDNDEDDEDLFELVRRKYNLQIDSDEDDVDVKR